MAPHAAMAQAGNQTLAPLPVPPKTPNYGGYTSNATPQSTFLGAANGARATFLS